MLLLLELAVLLGLIIWVLAGDAGTSAAFIAELRLFGLVFVPIVAVTTLFTAFFEWRRGLRQRLLQHADEWLA
jgi:hypothetical protein